ncbi:MAG: hypothetical protein WBD20_01020 [Pirellulaceae bacterium]
MVDVDPGASFASRDLNAANGQVAKVGVLAARTAEIIGDVVLDHSFGKIQSCLRFVAFRQQI